MPKFQSACIRLNPYSYVGWFTVGYSSHIEILDNVLWVHMVKHIEEVFFINIYLHFP